jgi:putative membrane protein insertion efficiency factor
MSSGPIRTYQRITAGRVSACRFYPSCSNYALEAIELHGAWRGFGLALRRLSRCRPFGPHGVDLVPHPHARSTR